MYYRDLSCYRDGSEEEIVDVFPSVKNIGWLGSEHEFPKGRVSAELLEKLRELIFLDLKYEEDQKKGKIETATSINIHCMHVRGSPYLCPFCTENIAVEYAPGGLALYKGSRLMTAGSNEVVIPSLKEGEFYSFPTLLLHYVSEHNYLPPREFLDALGAFDLGVGYDLDMALADLEVLEVGRSELEKYNSN